MERQEILAIMDELKLAGMRAAFDEVLANGLKRQHPVPRPSPDVDRGCWRGSNLGLHPPGSANSHRNPGREHLRPSGSKSAGGTGISGPYVNWCPVSDEWR